MPSIFYAVPFFLSLGAAAIVKVGWPRAERYRNPRRFRAGLITLASGLVALWLLPVCVALTVETMELRGILYMLSLVVAGALANGGVEDMRRANQTPTQNSWEKLFEFFKHF